MQSTTPDTIAQNFLLVSFDFQFIVFSPFHTVKNGCFGAVLFPVLSSFLQINSTFVTYAFSATVRLYGMDCNNLLIRHTLWNGLQKLAEMGKFLHYIEYFVKYALQSALNKCVHPLKSASDFRSYVHLLHFPFAHIGILCKLVPIN